MKDTITHYQFTDVMTNSLEGFGFSYEGSKELFEYLEGIDPEIEFDPIAIRCDFSEYDSFEELQKDYDVQDIEELERHTTVIEVPNSTKLIIQAY